MSVNFQASVPKLKGRENYDEWAFGVENVLVLDGLWECVKGSESDSDKNAKAKARIVLTIDPPLYPHIKEEATPKAVWEKLQKMFANAGQARRIGLLKALISTKLENCVSMGDYVNKVVETAQRLKATGFPIDEEWIGSLLLAGLPDKYSPMIMGIEASGIEITADAIKTKLLDMEVESSKGAAFLGGGGGNKVSVRKKKIRCYSCNEYGHFQYKCPNIDKQEKKEPKKEQKDTKKAFSTCFLSGQFQKNEWYVDSGASNHFCVNKNWLENVSDECEVQEIIVANETKVKVECKGDVILTTVCASSKNDILVQNVVCVPELATNLLSVSQLTKKGNSVEFNEQGCQIYNKNKELVATADLIQKVYRLNIDKSDKCWLTTGDTWHRRFGHINSNDLNKMKSSKAVEGLDFKGEVKCSKKNCKICCEGKQHRKPFPREKEGQRAEELLELIHADLCGPMDISLGGSRYFALFEDDASRMAFVYFLKTKNEVMAKFLEFKAMVENQTNKKIKHLRTDGGGEYCSKEFEGIFKKFGIVHQKTTPYTPEQNGMSERMNRTLVEKARCLLYDAKLDVKFWAEAVHTAVYIRNRSLASGLNNRTPYEIWHQRKPSVQHFRIFGSKVMVHIPKAKRTKWDKKSQEMILVGYSDVTKGYRVYNPEIDDIIVSRDVIVMEDEVQIVISQESTPEVGEKQEELTEERSESSDLESTLDEKVVDNLNDSDFQCDVQRPDDDNSNTRRRSERGHKPKTFNDYVTYLSQSTIKSPKKINLEEDPVSVDDALSRPDSDKWKHAMAEELMSFDENDAWDIVDIPESGTVVDCKWVFKRKKEGDNSVRYRARLVARGFTQVPGIDFDETYSPVDLQFKLQCRLKVFDNTDLSSFPTTHNLVSCASRYGLLFVGSNINSFQVIQTKQLHNYTPKDKDVSTYPRRKIDLPSTPKHLSVNCDNTILAVVVEKNQCPVVIFYDVLSFLSSNVKVLLEVRLSPTPNVFAKEVNWNPSITGVFTACKSDGSLAVCELKGDSFELNELPFAAGVTSFCWSPKGKQIAVGSKDGKITQYKPDLKPVKAINAPPLGGVYSLICLQWVSNFQFIGVYQSAQPEGPACVILVDAPKAGEISYTNYEDICYSGSTRMPQFYFIMQQTWNLLMVASANSTEIGVLSAEGDKWTQWIIQDSARAELPLGSNHQETLPVGFGFDYSSTVALPWGESQIPPCPTLLLLSHQGVLCCFNVVYLKKDVPTVCTPPDNVADMSGLSAFVQGGSQKVETPQQHVSVPAPKQVPKFAQPDVTPVKPTATQPSQSSLFGGGASLASSSQQPLFGNSTAPALAQQPLFGGPTSKPLVGGQQTSQKPGASLFGGQTTITPTKSISSSENNQFGGQITITPIAKSATSQPPMPKTEEKYSKIFSSVQSPAAPSSSAGTTQSTVVIKTEPKLPKKDETYAVQPETNIPKNEDQKLKAETNAMLSQMVRDECTHLEAELKAILHQTKTLNINVGTDQEKTHLVRELGSLEEFIKEVMDITSGQNSEIHCLKQNLIQSWALYEEATSHYNASKDEALNLLLKAQPLDSLAEKRLNDIKQMIYYVDSQLSQANKALDALWDGFQDYAKKIHRVKMPTMETIFQTMVRQNAVLQKQTYVLKDISMRLKKKNSTTNLSLLRLNGKHQDLVNDFTKLRLNSQDILQLQYDKVLNQLNSLSELKTDKLRNLLKRKPVAHVTAIKPNLSSWTINQSPSKTKQMISLLGAHMSPVSKSPVARTLDFVQSTPMKPASTMVPTSMTFQTGNITSQASLNAFAGLGNKPGTSAFVQPQKSTGFVAISSSSNATNLFKPGSSTSATGATFTFASAQKPSFPMQQPKPTESAFKAEPTISFGALNIPSPQSQIIIVDPFKKSETKVESTKAVTSSATMFSFGASSAPSTISTGFPSTSSTQPLFGGTTSFFGSLASSAEATKPVQSVVSFSKPETSKPTQVASQMAATDLSKTSASTKAGLNLAASVGISKDFKPAEIKSSLSAQPGSPKNSFGIAPSTHPTTKPAETVTVTNASTAFSFAVKPSSSTSTTTSSTTSIFGGTVTSESSFGQSRDDNPVTKAQSLFGASAATTSQSVFGSSSSQGSIFGSTSTTTPTSATTSKPSLLSTPPATTSNIFGASPTTPLPEAGKPVFVVPTTTSSVEASKPFFGASSTSIFGTPASTGASLTATTSANIATTTASSTGLFGAGAGVGTSIFGAASLAKSTSESADLSSVVSTGASNTGLFGASTTTTSIFGTPVTSSSAPAPTTNIFGASVGTVPSSSAPSSTHTGIFGSTTTSTATNIFAAPASTTPSIPPFGNAAVTTISSNIFAAPTATNSSNVFGSPASTATSGGSIFGTSTSGSTAPSSVFGSPTAASTSASIFGAASSTSNVFGGNQSTVATTTSNIFGTSQSTAATTGTNVFGPSSTTSPTIFGTGTPAFGGQQSTSIFGGAQAQKPEESVFGQQTTFGTGFTAATITQSVFGTPATTQSVFGKGFGSTSSTTSAFGSPAAPVSQPTTQASFGFGSLSVSAGGTASSGGSIFGGGGGGSAFSQQQPSSPSNPFGKSSFSAGASSNTNLFGTPGTLTSSSGANLFGAPTATSASTFGVGFGSPSTFGSSPAFGQSATFGSGSSFGSPQPTGGAFSTGGATGTTGAAAPVAQAGFGSPAFQKPAAGFGSPPVFGGSPTSAFGGTPAFGAAPAFGSAPVFGSPDKVFGQTSQQSTATFGLATASQPNTGFGNLANQNTIGFGNLAQQANTQPAMPFSGGSGTSSFSSWR